MWDLNSTVTEINEYVCKYLVIHGFENIHSGRAFQVASLEREWILPHNIKKGILLLTNCRNTCAVWGINSSFSPISCNSNSYKVKRYSDYR